MPSVMSPGSSPGWAPHKVSPPGHGDFGDSRPAERTWRLETLGRGRGGHAGPWQKPGQGASCWGQRWMES